MSVYRFGPFHLDSSKRLLEKDGTPIRIGGRTLDLLIALIDRAGDVVAARELMRLIWPSVTVEEANLRVSVSALRKALGDGKEGARYIVNVAGRGYAFVAPVRTDVAACLSSAGSACSVPKGRPLAEMPQFLVGRDDTLGTLSHLLMSQRFVSVVGPGGIGKTTVALAVANGLRSRFGDDRVCFVDGGAISDPDDLPAAIASALGCPFPASSVMRQISGFLAKKPTLLILDNCEHIVEEAAEVSEYLFQSSDTLHLLTTSREALRVEGENVLLLQPLRYPLVQSPTALEAMATPAVQLFMERAASSGHLEKLGDEDAPTVSYICRRLDGIALAIELVASRVGLYGIRGTADLLDSGSELVLQGRRSALPRHQTLQALHDWSYRLLSAQEQKVLARLSVFVGELTLTAAHAVAGDPEDDRTAIAHVISTLSDKSLIQVCSAQGRPRYRLLDATRAYASHKLAERHEADEIRRRHASYQTSTGNHHASHANPDIGIIGGAMVRNFPHPAEISIGLGRRAYAA